MPKLSKHIFKQDRPSLRGGFFVIFIWWVGCVILSLPQPSSYIETKISYPLDFSIRDFLKMNPKFDPKLKIITIDDATVAWLNRSYLNIGEWGSFIKSMVARKPRVILIDKIFGLADSSEGNLRKQKLAESNFSNLKANLIGGAFVGPEELPGRDQLNIKSKPFLLKEYLRADLESIGLSFLPKRPVIAKSASPFVYGPYEQIRSAFDGVGHIHYAADHKVEPFLRLNAQSVLPYFGLFVADQFYFKGSRLFADGVEIPTLKDGRVPINFAPPKDYLEHAISARKILPRAFNNRSARQISKGDVVVVLPSFYTGNTDFKDTPFGQMPAAYAHVSFINSVLQSNWIKSTHPGPLWSAVFCIVGALLAIYLTSLLSVFALIAANLAVFAASEYLFAYQSFMIPWFYALISMSGSWAVLFVVRSRFNERKSKLVRYSLDGSISEKKTKEILRGNEWISFDAREQVVSVMFIDVVGFSLMAENQVPRIAFDYLKNLIRQITNEVHSHGGMVNKTLGDGLLCIFGYDFQDDNINSDHAEKALDCAVSIQKKNLKRNLWAAKQGEPVFPLRIGVHSASVFLGDLGVGDRLDFTAIGNGVNYAKRLEQACEVHTVLFSSTTRDLSASLGLDPSGLKKKMISIKHHTSLMEAYEFNPFWSEPEIRGQALEAYRQTASLARLEQRFSVRRPDYFEVMSSIGKASLINYSLTGISIKLRSHMVKGSVLMLRIESSDSELGKALATIGVGDIQVEVRWAFLESDGAVHGLMYRNVEPEIASQLFEILKKFDTGIHESSHLGKSA